MFRKWLTLSSLFLIISISLSGYLMFNINSDNDPYKSRENNTSRLTKKEYIKKYLNDFSGNNTAETYGSVYYQDNFDGSNDTTSLKNRGYKIFTEVAEFRELLLYGFRETVLCLIPLTVRPQDMWHRYIRY